MIRVLIAEDQGMVRGALKALLAMEGDIEIVAECQNGFEAVKVGGVEDHAHALLILPPTIPLSKAIQTIKACSSKWLNETEAIKNFAWQEGYGAFSVSASQTAEVIRYIENQASHHAKRSYEDEFLELLKRYGVQYDPAHVLG